MQRSLRLVAIGISHVLKESKKGISRVNFLKTENITIIVEEKSFNNVNSVIVGEVLRLHIGEELLTDQPLRQYIPGHHP